MQTATPRILFVDDHDDTRFLIKAWLAMSHYEVATAANVASGLQAAQSTHFDLYVLDTRLPDGTGRELCAKIREIDPLTPIIFYSGDSDALEPQTALELGAQGCVMKPEIELLRATIDQAISK